MKYAKLINNYPSYAPNPILHDSNYIGNPTNEIYEAEGYKQVEYTNQPESPGTGWWIETWTETKDTIVQGWTWHESTDEDEINPEEVLQILLGGNIE